MCGSTKAKITQAFDDEVYAVRCVSDVDRSADGWRSNCAGIWGQSYFDRSCHTLNWESANDFCHQQNARLPTVAELIKDCTQGSGCGFDTQQAWTSTALTTGDVSSGDNYFNIFQIFEL